MTLDELMGEPIRKRLRTRPFFEPIRTISASILGKKKKKKDRTASSMDAWLNNTHNITLSMDAWLTRVENPGPSASNVNNMHIARFQNRLNESEVSFRGYPTSQWK